MWTSVSSQRQMLIFADVWQRARQRLQPLGLRMIEHHPGFKFRICPVQPLTYVGWIERRCAARFAARRSRRFSAESGMMVRQLKFETPRYHELRGSRDKRRTTRGPYIFRFNILRYQALPWHISYQETV